MSRARRANQRQLDEEISRRRNSAANRALRRRAAQGKRAHASGLTPVEPRPQSADAPITPVAQDPDGMLAHSEATATIHGDQAQRTPADVAGPDVANADVAGGGGQGDGPAEAAVRWDHEDAAGGEPSETQGASDTVTDDPAAAEPMVADPPADNTEVFDPVPSTSTVTAAELTPGKPAEFPQPNEQTVAQRHWDEAAIAAPVHPEQSKARPKRRRAWIIPFVLVFVCVLYVGAQALVSSTVPTSTQTLGIAIGGMSAVQAQGAIDAHVNELTAANLELRAAEQVFELPAADAGLDIDAAATVAQVTGFTLAPDRLWAHVMGGSEIEPVVVVDDEVLAEALDAAAAQVDGPAQDAGVTVVAGQVTVVPGRSAVTVDKAASANVIAQQWPSAQSIELVAQTEEPAITDDDAEAFALDLESQTFAAPVTLVGDDAEATLEPAILAAHSTVVSGATGLALEMDGEGLAAAVLDAYPELTTAGKNASVSFDADHQIVIDEGTPGITIDADRMGTAVMAAASSIDRMGELPYTAADPEVSATDLGLADFKERIVTFNTPITADRVRTQNLRAAARDVTGTILHPGDTFDLVDTLQPITQERGYGSAGVIVNGILTTGMGGGLSQMATNVYNAAYFAGWEILEHRPHSVWLPRYPAGRESTMYTGSINVVFKNNTPYSAVLNSYVENGRLYVDVWSTKYFEVETYASEKTNVRQPGVKEVTAANCEAKGPGQPGFTITNTRKVLLDGAEFRSDSYTWTYQPDDAIKCVSPHSADDEDPNK